MARLTKGIRFSGPFFDKDPAKTFKDNVHDFVEQLAKAGEADVTARLTSVPRKTRGNRQHDPVQTYVRGRVESLTGRQWHRTAVVSPVPSGLDRRQTISLMAAASYMERNYHPWRSGRNAVRRAAKSAARDLLRGL